MPLPQVIRSRAIGGWRFVNQGIRPIGAVVGGMAGGLIGVRETLFVGAIGSALAFLFVLFSPVRSLRAIPEAMPDEAA